ncbi:MAG TPA: GyrI-like domain-containing protein [Puia sp.]|nr:GyrI-like domain-containing protein [Puia sp.]
MKKWGFLLLALLILTLFSIYLFIPSKIVISNITFAEATINGEFRYINQEGQWEKWWHDTNGKAHIKGEPFTYNGSVFRLTKQINNVVGIEIEQDGKIWQSVILLFSLSTDSTGAHWRCEISAGNSPIKRIMSYRNAVRIKSNMTGVMKNFSTFISNPQNIYGIHIYRTSTRDTAMLSARFKSQAYPITAELYSYFDKVEKAILKQKGKVTGFPMMNVRKMEDGSFETQVAIPTNHVLENDGKILFRRMVPGNFICTDVRGGTFTVNDAMNQLDLFISEYHKSRMANTFQSLVTNRINEPDTQKWITKIYIPVVE